MRSRVQGRHLVLEYLGIQVRLTFGTIRGMFILHLSFSDHFAPVRLTVRPGTLPKDPVFRVEYRPACSNSDKSVDSIGYVMQVAACR